MSIKRFLTICFVSISIILFGLSCAPKISQGASAPLASATKISCFSFPDTSNLRLRATISINNVQLSGIMISNLKRDTVTAMFINEFGINGFSFKTCGGKLKFLTVMSNLDKWYIKRVLSKDLAFMFMVAKTPENGHFFIYNSTKFQYELNSSGTISKAKRIPLTCLSKDNGMTGILESFQDTIRFRNLKQNITYTFTPIK